MEKSYYINPKVLNMLKQDITDLVVDLQNSYLAGVRVGSVLKDVLIELHNDEVFVSQGKKSISGFVNGMKNSL